ncbi:uncharacterized protein [Physcomitrium patens]|uniref:Transcription factor HY5 n=1 Tax=Physcomitrium patens TaxID=3218 RepID=A0A2K1KBC6_PHYPA|nr:transcription factor HY5-like [Physcomitrium patens]PNR51080.1 hypothetical protein PHYPA_010266 [Physcomitrium patens]|eukprot:XP_024381386.1 transcription factor HY5-like [Physcomitrella patens]
MTDFDETQGDSKVHCEADSEADHPSDCYSSESGDETDAEVPDVTDPLACGSNLLQGAGNGKRFPKLTSVVGNNSSVANSSRRGFREGVDIGRNWKPVNFGEHQGLEGILPMQVSSVGPGSSPASSKQQTGTDMSVSPPLANAAVDKLMKDGNESDCDVRRVPELSAKTGGGVAGSHTQEKGPTGSSHRKRGGASADKEHKRLKRLLRNRVSAQQARERKKAYLSELEIRSKELEHRNAELEERVSTLQRENQMLRQIVKTTALKKTYSGGNAEGGAQ